MKPSGACSGKAALRERASAFDGLLDHTFGVAYSNLKSTGFSPDNGPSENAGNRIKADWQGTIRLSDQQHLILGAEHQKDSISQPISADINIKF